MPTSTATYHHGDLRAALLRTAMELLEESGETALSLRAVARCAGVSPAAPYPHYADRKALVSAVAAVGYREPSEHLAAPPPWPSTPQALPLAPSAYLHSPPALPPLSPFSFHT